MPDEPYYCYIPGRPEPQGSTRAFNVPGRDRPIVTSDNPALKGWRALAVMLMRQAMPATHTAPLFGGAVWVAVEFALPRLAAHPKRAPCRGKNPHWVTTRPDLDKLVRAVGDALVVASVLRDDSWIVQWSATKRFARIGEAPGTHIRVAAVAEQEQGCGAAREALAHYADEGTH